MFFQFDNRVTPPIVDVALLAVVERYAPKLCFLVQVQSADRSLADTRCIREHGIEHRLEFARRT